MAAKKHVEPIEITPEIMVKVKALRYFPGNGDLGIKPWKEYEERTLPKSLFDRLLQDRSSSWEITLL